MKKKPIAIALASTIALSGVIALIATRDDTPVRKVANWAE